LGRLGAIAASPPASRIRRQNVSQTSEIAIGQLPSPERRQHARLPVRVIVYVKLDESNGGIALNVSERGLSVQAVTGLRDDSLPAVRFQLPPSPDWIEAPARVVWASDSKKVAGLWFADLPERECNRIREWLEQEAAVDRVPAQPQGVPDAAEKVPAESVNRETIRTNGSKTTARPPTTAAGVGPVTTAPESSPGAMLAQGLSYSRHARPQSSRHRVPAKKRLTSPLREHGALVMLLLLFAVVSLAAGWVAGRKSIGWKPQEPPAAKVPDVAVTQEPTPPAEVMAPAPANEAENSTSQTVVTPPPALPDTPIQPQRIATRRNPLPQSIQPQPNISRWLLAPASHPVLAVSLSRTETPSAPLPIGVSGVAAALIVSPASVPEPKSDFATPVFAPTTKQPSSALLAGALIHRVEPAYPSVAQEHGIGGTVNLRVTVGRDGTVRKVKVISGPSLLRPAATNAVRQWRYEPSLVKGKPVEVDREVSVEFQLPRSSR